jgi:hypothetical protein
VSGGDDPIACEYETDAGGACRNIARLRLVFVQIGATSMTGEPVKFFAHACFEHSRRARVTPESIRLESVEEI